MYVILKCMNDKMLRDASALAPSYGGVPAINLGPGEAAMAHQTDVYCVVNRIGEAVEAYTRIGRRWNTW